MKRILILRSMLLLLCLIALPNPVEASGKMPADAAGPANADALKRLRMIWTADPQSRAMICWDTAAEGEDHRVYYDIESREGVIGSYRSMQASIARGPYCVHPKSNMSSSEHFL